jgi:hypothetical protein
MLLVLKFLKKHNTRRLPVISLYFYFSETNGMKQFFLYIVFFTLLSATVSGQGLIKPELPAIDTTEILNPEFLPDRPLTNFLAPAEILKPDLNFKNFKFPKFDFNQGLLNFKQDYSYYIFNPGGTENLNLPFGAFPFVQSAVIFNQAAYKLSDKFLIGGNSFGGKSIFSAPFPNSGINQFDTRGASMFFQYKVSKNFKIETRVSVTDRQF